MNGNLFDALGEIHRFDELEDLLDFAADAIVSQGRWSLALLTFYFGDEMFIGLAGGKPGMKDRFRGTFHTSSAAGRERKRQEILEYARPGTNVCFIPAGEGPSPSDAYVPTPESRGSWLPDDRLMIFMRDWRDRILGVLSLDGPTGDGRPTEEEFRSLEQVDLFVNLTGKIAENQFWSLRLKESEESYRGIFDAAMDGFFIFDDGGVIVEANPAACRMHGMSHEDLIGSPGGRIIHPKHHEMFKKAVTQVLSGERLHIESVHIRPDGSALDVEGHAVRFAFLDRPHILAAFRDVTERKHMIEHLVRQEKEESVVTVAGGVAHDFNNILMGITGSLSLLRHHLPEGGKARDHTDRISSSAARLTELTNQLLAVAKGTQSKFRSVLVSEAIHEALALIGGVVRSRLRVDVHADEGLWPVEADRVQIERVILNLCLNAWDATGESGRVKISVGNTTRDEPWESHYTGTHKAGDYVRLAISDDGCGMSAETLEHLFEPFFSTKSGGSGLGLAAVLGIVRRHSGAVHVESRTDQGTTVEILFPRSRIVSPPEEKETENPDEAVAARKVLLVDDEPVVREVAAEMLTVLGFQVETAESGADALALFTGNGGDIDLVLLDVQMPRMSGIEVSRRLREIDPDVRILLTSGHTESIVREDMPGGGGVNGFIQKPYTLEDLSDAIEAALTG